MNRGGQIKLYVNTVAPSFTMDIFRMGYYGGAGARRMLPTITRSGTKQVIPAPDALGLVELQLGQSLRVHHTCKRRSH